jgi:hypothetical protein
MLNEVNSIKTQPLVVVNTLPQDIDIPQSLLLSARNVGNAIANGSIKENPYSPIFQEQADCKNKYNHVSAFPGFGRVICPICVKTYVKKEMK